MTDHFEGLRIPQEALNHRHDTDWDRREQGHEHRVAVLRALQNAAHDALVARVLQKRETGRTTTAEEEEAIWDPVWDALRDCLTRQDLLRWLLDWAVQSQQEAAMETVVRMTEELDMLDDASGSWRLTQNPG